MTPEQIQQALNAWVDRYGPATGEDGAVLFFTEALGATLDPWQERVIRAYGRGERRISIASCHGPGKTFVAAGCATLQLSTRFPQKTAMTAPTKGQMEDALFAEVVTLMDKLPREIRDLFNVTATRIEFIPKPNRSFLAARTARDEKPEALQGVHEEEGWVLLIGDESSGIGDPIFEASAGSMSGTRCTTILLSNPTKRTGFFYDTHHILADMWFREQVSYKDSSRVSPDFVEDIRRRYGEHSNAFRIRCLGQFPKGDDDAIIPWEWMDQARHREIFVLPGTRIIWGLDVAEKGDDRSVLWRRQGPILLPKVNVWRGLETMALVGRVMAVWHSTPLNERPEEIMIDAIGYGAGVASRLAELGLPARAVNVSESPSTLNELKYRNKRTELYYVAREWFETHAVAIPEKLVVEEEGQENLVEAMVEELAIVTGEVMDSSGKMKALSKKEMRKKIRGGKSPDLGAAFLLTFASWDGGATRVNDKTALGKGVNVPFNQPIKLNRNRR